MGSSLDGRAHAAMLLRVLADTAADSNISIEELAALAEKIGAHLRDEAVASAVGANSQPQLRLIEGGLRAPVAQSS
jgi:hypothetical protein